MGTVVKQGIPHAHTTADVNRHFTGFGYTMLLQRKQLRMFEHYFLSNSEWA